MWLAERFNLDNAWIVNVGYKNTSISDALITSIGKFLKLVHKQNCSHINKKILLQWTNIISVCIYTFSSNIVGTLNHLTGSLFKINKKTANDNKINSNTKFMFAINNPKETHLWLFSKIFNKQYSSSVWYIQLKEKKKLMDLPYNDDHSFDFWNIFSFAHFCFNF